MRISDWSSDVCSSDLGLIDAGAEEQQPPAAQQHAVLVWKLQLVRPIRLMDRCLLAQIGVHRIHIGAADLGEVGVRECRIEQRAVLRAAIMHGVPEVVRSEEHTSELQSLMRISYAVFCLKKKNKSSNQNDNNYKLHNTSHMQ